MNYIKPKIEVIRFDNTELLNSSQKGGHGWGDNNHDHHHKHDKVEDEESENDSYWPSTSL